MCFFFSGPSLALCLAREDAVQVWRDMLGPKDMVVAAVKPQTAEGGDGEAGDGAGDGEESEVPKLSKGEAEETKASEEEPR